jgi:hypothetical protein
MKGKSPSRRSDLSLSGRRHQRADQKYTDLDANRFNVDGVGWTGRSTRSIKPKPPCRDQRLTAEKAN